MTLGILKERMGAEEEVIEESRVIMLVSWGSSYVTLGIQEEEETIQAKRMYSVLKISVVFQ